MLSRAPEHPGTLRRDRQADTEVFQVKFVVRLTNDEFIPNVSCKGAGSCAKIKPSSGEFRYALAELVYIPAY